MDINQLEEDIKYYSKQYYLGTPKILDEQFDALVSQLRLLNPSSELLKTGWGFEVQGNKVKHKYSHIGSLAKAKSYDEFNDIFKNNYVYISPKLDGLSAVCYYENGRLVKAITRGNGEYGKDITKKLKFIEGQEIKDKTFTGSVRGELIINRDNWNKIKEQSSEELIAPRNYVAGIINRDEIDNDIRYVDFVTYKILGNENFNHPYEQREDILLWLSQNFKHSVPIYYFMTLTSSYWEEYHKQIFERFKEMGYELDGLVLTLRNIPYDSINQTFVYSEQAFKFESETTATEIESIEWTLSKNQRLVPVAILKPVQLSGAIIQRATCNNAKEVRDWGLGKGAQVVITRSNEVIPRILIVIEESQEELPMNCPICNQPLEWKGVDLVCNNPNCPNIDESNLEQWCTIIGETDGLQWTIMKQYLDSYNIHSINDLYEKEQLVYNDLLNRKLSITEEKILLFFNKLYKDQVEVYKVLLALNIPSLGDKTCKLLAQNSDIVYCLYRYSIGKADNNFTEESLKEMLLPIVKEAKTNEILNNMNKFANMSYLYSAENVTRIIVPNINKENQYVAVTGSLNTMKRKDFEKYIQTYGYELTSTLSKCKYLITNDPNSSSSKNKEADKYNIPKITEQQFLEMLK